MKILVAVDGSKPSLKAVQALIDHAERYSRTPEVELLTVHLPVPAVGRVPKAQLERYYLEEGQAKLEAAKKKLDAAGIAYKAHVLVGPVAEAIVKHAKDKRCDMIVIGTRGMGPVGAALIGSTALKVLHISETPVLLVK
ncbi:MAG TPA: universal stress protein [Burkholderiales bacterium]|nr:universal stress protein [Burkholderiales bacterium]